MLDFARLCFGFGLVALLCHGDANDEGSTRSLPLQLFLIVYTEDVLFCFGLPILTNSSLCYFPDNNDHEKREPVWSKSIDSFILRLTPLAVSDLV